MLLSSLISYILPFISKNLAIKYFCVIVIIVIITYLLYPKYEIHLHHFFIASFFMPITTLKNNDGLSLLVQGILLGIYIQAVTVWGLAWIWVKNKMVKKT